MVTAEVLGAGDALAGARLVTGHAWRATHFRTRDGVAVSGGRDGYLAGAGRWWGVAVRLKHVGTHVLRAGDGAAGAGFVAGGAAGAISAGTGHRLAGCGLAGTNLPAGIRSSGDGFHGAVDAATGTAGSLAVSLLRLRRCTGSGLEFAHLLGQFTARQFGVALAGDRSTGDGGGCAGRLAVFGHGQTASQHEGAAGALGILRLGTLQPRFSCSTTADT